MRNIVPIEPLELSVTVAEDTPLRLSDISYPHFSGLRVVAIITSVSGVTILNSLGNGLLTIGLPTIVKDINIPESLQLWPASVYSLACGCFLLFNGQLS